MKRKVQQSAWWGALMLACCGALLWSPPAVAQTALLDRLTADSQLNLLSNGGFEAGAPAYWAPTGAGASWSMEVARTPLTSLKLSGAGEAAWTQEEAVRNWVAAIKGNQEIIVGGYVKTEGVNTNPTSDAEKYQLLFEFFDAAGNDLLGGPVAIDLPQGQASTDGWVQLDNTSLGALTLPADAPSMRITFRKGASATGAAYLDDLFLYNAGEGDWPGGLFNTNIDASAHWYYWWPDFDQGKADWPENQPFVLTTTEAAAHTGQRSLMIEEQLANPSQEAVAISERVAVTEGEPVLVSFWLKTEGVVYPDSMGISDYNVGLTALFYNNMEGGAAGYGEIGGLDIRLNGEYNPNVIPLHPRQASTGWTQYAFVVYPRQEAVGMELRLRYWHKFEGTTYWDDVFITPLGGSALVGTAIEDDVADGELPQQVRLHQNFPNPFNPSTRIAFDLEAASDVSLAVYDLLGRRVATLLDGRALSAGTHTVTFEAGGLPSGMYLYVLKTGNRTEARTMVLLK